VGDFPWVLACIPFIHVGFSSWDELGQIRFVGVDGFDPIIEELVSVRSDLGFMDVYGLGIHWVQKWLGLIRVLGPFPLRIYQKS